MFIKKVWIICVCSLIKYVLFILGKFEDPIWHWVRQLNILKIDEVSCFHYI